MALMLVWMDTIEMDTWGAKVIETISFVLYSCSEDHCKQYFVSLNYNRSIYH